MDPNRLALMTEAGWFPDDIETDGHAFERHTLPVRAIDSIGASDYPGPGVRISDACFVGRYLPVTSRRFREPLSVLIGQGIARVLKRFGR